LKNFFLYLYLEMYCSLYLPLLVLGLVSNGRKNFDSGHDHDDDNCVRYSMDVIVTTGAVLVLAM
jgi:hypothetical protein